MIFSRTLNGELSQELLHNLGASIEKHFDEKLEIVYAVSKNKSHEQFSPYEMFKGNLTKY